MDIFKKSFHKVELVVEEPKWKFTCHKCDGEWIMMEKKGLEPIFSRPYVSCPHCRTKAKVKK